MSKVLKGFDWKYGFFKKLFERVCIGVQRGAFGGEVVTLGFFQVEKVVLFDLTPSFVDIAT